MKIRILNIVLVFAAVLTACVNSIDVNINSASGKLVVEGTITDQPGPYTVRLSNSKDFFDISSEESLFQVINAIVSIEDDQGNFEVFSEVSAGVYQSTVGGLTGVVGRSYKLKIKLEDGNSYESNTELLRPNTGIKELKTEQKIKKVLSESNLELEIDGIELSVVPNDFEENKDYYRWRWEGTYEVETFPQLSVTAGFSTPPVPSPVACSGYIARGQIIAQIRPCECCTCWISESSELSIVSNTTIGQSKVNLNFVENSLSRFDQKYHVRIQQLSLSKEAHEFWKIIKQQQNSGSLFSTSSSEVPTNIKSMDDPNEKVLGYFIATSISETTTFLDRTALSKTPVKLDTITDDCRRLYNATNQKPLFW